MNHKKSKQYILWYIATAVTVNTFMVYGRVVMHWWK